MSLRFFLFTDTINACLFLWRQRPLLAMGQNDVNAISVMSVNYT
jgi:hypothetical protein